MEYELKSTLTHKIPKNNNIINRDMIQDPDQSPIVTDELVNHLNSQIN